MQRFMRFARSKSLILGSVALLLATAYLFCTYGSAAYFAAFHRPIHLVSFHSRQLYTPPVLPRFSTDASIASPSLRPGDTQVITVAEIPNRTVSGYIDVWVQNSGTTGPLKNVYQNDTSGKPTQFVKGRKGTFTYLFALPHNLPAGTYTVSYIITSSDTFTDYSVNNKFAAFTVL